MKGGWGEGIRACGGGGGRGTIKFFTPQPRVQHENNDSILTNLKDFFKLVTSDYIRGVKIDLSSCELNLKCHVLVFVNEDDVLFYYDVTLVSLTRSCVITEAVEGVNVHIPPWNEGLN